MAEKKAAATFDEGMAALERIVARLEAGDLPLEEALVAFESGVSLVRELSKRLSDAEARVEVLSRNADGTARLAPLDVDADGED